MTAAPQATRTVAFVLISSLLATLFVLFGVGPAQAEPANRFPIDWTDIGIHPRQAPAMSAEHAGPALMDGTLVSHICEVAGEPVYNGQETIDVWALTEYGWLPTAWINTGYDGWTPNVPDCGEMTSNEESTQPGCVPYIVVGVPGSHQGALQEENLGSSDEQSRLGPEVHAVVEAMRAEGLELGVAAVAYPALLNTVTAKAMYNLSSYKESKDKGYSATYDLLKVLARECPNSKFFLIGYSQGAHIVGDVAQTIYHEGGPVDRNRIAGVVLLADPAFNSSSPGAEEFVANGSALSYSPVDSQDITGSLGTRAAFPSDARVFSVCIQSDPVCNLSALNLPAEGTHVFIHAPLDAMLGAQGEGPPSNVHGIYDDAPILEWGVESLAQFAGSMIASTYTGS
ncbi:cutinase family protein [Rhodococcus sp. YH1]|uniref:cutinase family protein n=1 Tax=Rhodococcus sp. YH1 TaxID=89066 RepID=UPI001387394D|nr:hypothetical protein [Rhodococcus sp. YH1]NCL78612.1 hypothetical protein [Rhodococcus sp. YH1]